MSFSTNIFNDKRLSQQTFTEFTEFTCVCVCLPVFVFTCEVGRGEEVMWQRLVGDHGPGQVFQLSQVSKDATECWDSQTSVVMQQHWPETSQLTDGG